MIEEARAIRNILAGHTDEYRILVDRYQVGLIIHCENIVRDRYDAEDIAQDAFVKAYRSLADFDDTKARFSTWLYRIATNMALDHLRRNKRTVNTDDIEKLAGVTMPEYLEQDEKELIRRAVLQLQPPKYCKVVQGYYWQGKSYDELALEFGTSASTIGTWLRRAKAQLRKEIVL